MINSPEVYDPMGKPRKAAIILLIFHFSGRRSIGVQRARFHTLKLYILSLLNTKFI